MPGMFIDVTVDPSVAKDADLAKKLEEVCPVSIFDASGDELRIGSSPLWGVSGGVGVYS